MAQVIPLQPVPSQQAQCVLDGQQCQLSVYVKQQCMFLDLIVNGEPIIYASQCENLVNIVSTSYLGFSGWLVFVDTQGAEDPQYFGLGSRWQLVYLDLEDIAAAAGY